MAFPARNSFSNRFLALQILKFELWKRELPRVPDSRAGGSLSKVRGQTEQRRRTMFTRKSNNASGIELLLRVHDAEATATAAVALSGSVLLTRVKLRRDTLRPQRRSIFRSIRGKVLRFSSWARRAKRGSTSDSDKLEIQIRVSRQSNRSINGENKSWIRSIA